MRRLRRPTSRCGLYSIVLMLRSRRTPNSSVGPCARCSAPTSISFSTSGSGSNSSCATTFGSGSRDGFVEASHITRDLKLEWGEQALLNLVVRRLLDNDPLVEFYSVTPDA